MTQTVTTFPLWRGRLVWSLVLLAAFYGIRGWLIPASAVMSARLAGGQFANSDASAVVAIAGSAFFSGIGAWFALIAFVLLLVIWYAPAKAAIKMLLEEV